MKALIYTGPNALTYADVADPVPVGDEVLVRVEAVGICGSDMHAYHGYDERRPAPLILGHEAAGRIVHGHRSGELVTINPLVVCGDCPDCLDGRSHLCRQRQIISMPARPGAFAELVCIPERNVVPVPHSLDVVRAALAEPIAVAWHAVRVGAERLRRPLAAARCVVLGGGAIGLAAALVLDNFGAHDISLGEPSASRRRTATRSGPITAYAPGDAAEPADGTIDLVLDAVGASATRAAACRMVKPGGVIVHTGLLPGSDGLDLRRITLQEISVVGTYCYTHVDFLETVAAMAAGRLGQLDWLSERPLSEGALAFGDLDRGDVAAAKVVLRP